MDEALKRLASLSEKQSKLLAAGLQQRLDALRRQDHEPLAILGMGCRFPGGAHTSEDYWQRLHDGVDCISEMHRQRWPMDDFYDPDPDRDGKIYTRGAGLLDDVEHFDAEFFGISPREAAVMDPQQRLLLETSWEALEEAGYAAGSLSERRVGVFVGIATSDYSHLEADPAAISAYHGSGNSFSVAAGRLSYFFGFEGPSLSVDTACSSSLVTTHLACQSLRRKECRMALVGGVNLMLFPAITLTFCRARMLAPDGRCKTFDARADGYVRGEGCGMMVLKRLSDALDDGDPIVAVIRGTAVNQDGRSQGLTAPNGPSQERVLRAALADAGLGPDDVDYVEAHGTGTSLGDPIEIQALDTVYGRTTGGREPLLVGSVKTNVGHMEAAAGIGGLMKVVMALRHGQIPPHLHLRNLNPALRLDPRRLRIPTELTPWPENDRPRRGAVSSFAFNGTNAHVVVEQAPSAEPAAEKPAPRPAYLFRLSARSEAALHQLAQRTLEHLRRPTVPDIGDLCYTSQLGRGAFQHRVGLLVKDVDALREGLAALTREQANPRTVRGQAAAQPPGVVFLFTGQGSQYAGMGKQLYDLEPRFRNTLDHCAEVLAELHADGDRTHGAEVDHVPLLSLLWGDHQHLLHHTEHTQPALFALEIALAELWQSWGILPEAVVGHSVGEVAAACVAGVFSRDDGLALIAGRGRAMAAVRTAGAMAAVLEPLQAMEARLQPYGDRVVVAAVNGPRQTVISGEPAAVAEVCAASEAAGVRATPLDVSHAFHSPQMHAARASLAAVTAKIRFQPPRLPVISNLTGAIAGDDIATADYWLQHLTRPVHFAQGMETLASLGPNILLEIGPKPVLLGMARRCLPDHEGPWLPSLRPRSDDWQQLLSALAELHVRGVEVDWRAVHRDSDHRRVALPTYPFQRKRHWYPSLADAGPTRPATARHSTRSVDAAAEHPLLGQRLNLPGLDEIRFEGFLGVDAPAFLNDHRVHGLPLVPAACSLAIMMAAQVELGMAPGLDDIAFLAPLVLDEHTPRRIQLVVSPDGRAFRLLALRPGAEPHRSESWTLQATASVPDELPDELPDESPTMITTTDLAAGEPVVDGQGLYQSMADVGFHFGPSLRWITRLWSQDDRVLTELEHPADDGDADGGGLGSPVDPRLIDAALQTLGAACRRPGETQGNGGTFDDGIFLPFRIRALRLTGRHSPGQRNFAHLRLHRGAPSPTVAAVDPGAASQAVGVRGDLQLLDAEGRAFLALTDTEFRHAEGSALATWLAAADRTSQDAAAATSTDGATAADTSTADTSENGVLARQLVATAPEHRISRLENHLRSELARVLRLEGPEEVDPRAQLFELGLDSLMAVELKNRLEIQIDRTLQATLLFDHPTPEALARFLVEHLDLAFESPEAAKSAAVTDLPNTPGTPPDGQRPASSEPAPVGLNSPAEPLSEAELANLSQDQLRDLLMAEIEAS